MAQALNFTPKAIAGLLAHPCPGAPGVAQANRYLATKLQEAQVFQLPDCGQLLDRSKPRPDVPGIILKPPFPVVALEYTAQNAVWDEGPYNAVSCPKRIALAWEWADDLPGLLRAWQPQTLGAGVVVASIFFVGPSEIWLASPVASHIAYDDEWQATATPTPFRNAMCASGRLSPKMFSAKAVRSKLVALYPEAIQAAVASVGSMDGAIDYMSADVMDETNAYVDLAMALACKNVGMAKQPAPPALNRARIKAGKLPLKDFHVLNLDGGAGLPGEGTGRSNDSRRSHLRRGHIRRISGDRVTWVNQTIVSGRGFLDKTYSIGGRGHG